MEEHRSPEAKIDFTLAVCRTRYAEMMKEEGIGTVFGSTIFGWRGDQLQVVCQLDREQIMQWPNAMHPSPKRRFEAVHTAAFALRRGCEVDSFTIVVEGYFTFVSREDDKPLNIRFGDGDPDVTEALISIHVDADTCIAGKQPLIVVVGREVMFGDIFLDDLPPVAAYPTAFRTALKSPVGAYGLDSDGLAAIGIHVQTMV